MEALQVKNLVKRYDEKVAVDDVSFTIQPGEFFGFLGPNGAGKSTTIGCITGLTTITEGSISVFGKDVVNDYKEARKLIGMSPQEFNIDIFRHPWETLLNNAGYFGMPRSQAKKRAEELLRRFDLWEHRLKPFQQLSGGMKRRVVLARALIHDPKLLILDEPTAGVDVELRRSLWRELKQIQKSGVTILLTTHYLEEAEKLCDRLAIISKGKLVLEDTTKNLLEKYGEHKLEQVYLESTGGDTNNNF
jgi:ABC-2 type transport system ATP-binding protein